MANEQNSANAQPSQQTPGGLVNFVRETQREIGKVTWPTRREVSVTTLMIVIFAIVAGVFFLVVDSALGYAVARILGMKS